MFLLKTLANLLNKEIFCFLSGSSLGFFFCLVELFGLSSAWLLESESWLKSHPLIFGAQGIGFCLILSSAAVPQSIKSKSLVFWPRPLIEKNNSDYIMKVETIRTCARRKETWKEEEEERKHENLIAERGKRRKKKYNGLVIRKEIAKCSLFYYDY